MSRALLLLIAVAIALTGCAGNDAGTPPIPGPPMTLNLTPSEITGNADPTVIDVSTLREILVLNPNGGGRTSIRAQYTGNDSAIKRDVQLMMPLEEELVEGMVIEFDRSNSAERYSVFLQAFTNDPEEAEVGEWGRSRGTFVVKRKVGRIVTVDVDALLTGMGFFATGTVRLQGEIVLDFSSPLWDDPSE